MFSKASFSVHGMRFIFITSSIIYVKTEAYKANSLEMRGIEVIVSEI